MQEFPEQIHFLTDASLKLGTGHVMRCLTLADRLRGVGLSVHFFCRNLPGHSGSVIEERGYGVTLIPNFEELTKILVNSRASLCVVDNYQIDAAFESLLRTFYRKIMVIDDLGRDHDCDLLLDQNESFRNHEKYKKQLPEACQKFLGSKYALLRPEFLKWKPRLRQGAIEKALCFFGGTDPTSETWKQASVICELDQWKWNVVVGANNPDIAKLEKLFVKTKHVQLFVQTNRMTELMDEADFYFGSGGTVTWERCYLGLPGAVISVADNQEDICETLDKMRCHENLGKSSVLREDDVRHGLLAMTPEKLKMYSENSLKLNVASRLSDLIATIQEAIREI